MTITSTDLQAALTAAGLPIDDYALAYDGQWLLARPDAALEQSHVRLTVTPHVFERLRADGWQEVAAGYLGRGILLAGMRPPDADAAGPAGAYDEAEEAPGYPSALAFATDALIRTRAAGHRVGDQRFGWSTWIVALVVMLVAALSWQDADESVPSRLVTVAGGALLGSILLLVLVGALIWIVRQYCGSRRIGLAHGRSTTAAVTQTVVATAVPVLVAVLAAVLLDGGVGTTITTLALLWALAITVLLSSVMFRVSIVGAVVAVVGGYLTLGVVCWVLDALLSFATR